MIYIRSTGIIAPQGGPGAPPHSGEPGARLHAVEPDYAKLIDPKLIRRMSRIIRMGVAAALECLNGAVPDAILTGTAYGCLEDTTIFLKRMIDNKEEMLTPTAFIQSTHNTVGAQIALLLQCHGYNNTFVHRGFSFESALLDALMLLHEGEARNVLVGGIDEITDTSHAILTRFGLYRHGAVNGEGAAFFHLDTEGPGVVLEALETFYKPTTTTHIAAFLARHAPPDLVLIGLNGDPANDRVYEALFPGILTETFKDQCGEYPTATAYALARAVRRAREINGRVLIYNHYQHIHHSLYLVSAC
jgi:3-oxoacyl-[acyl-carrier-protein] synthase II